MEISNVASDLGGQNNIYTLLSILGSLIIFGILIFTYIKSKNNSSDHSESFGMIVSPSMTEWVINGIKNGHSPEELKTQLIQSGKDPNIISSVLEARNKEIAKKIVIGVIVVAVIAIGVIVSTLIMQKTDQSEGGTVESLSENATPSSNSETNITFTIYEERVNWWTAKSNCLNRGERLPTMAELNQIYLTQSPQANKAYWSSEESGDSAGYVHFSNGFNNSMHKSFTHTDYMCLGKSNSPKVKPVPEFWVKSFDRPYIVSWTDWNRAEVSLTKVSIDKADSYKLTLYFKVRAMDGGFCSSTFDNELRIVTNDEGDALKPNFTDKECVSNYATIYDQKVVFENIDDLTKEKTILFKPAINDPLIEETHFTVILRADGTIDVKPASISG